MPPTFADRVAHILECINSIEQLLSTYTQSDLAGNRHLRLALEREFEIISEASRKIPDEIKASQSNIDWAGMATLGNRLRHAYHRVDLQILFDIAEADLPPLKAFVEEVVRNEGRDRKPKRP